MGSRKSMPASSDMMASFLLSGQLPDQRSGTKVTARPDEQFGPNRPICSLLPEYIERRDCREAACTGVTFFFFPSPLWGGGGGAREVTHKHRKMLVRPSTILFPLAGEGKFHGLSAARTRATTSGGV